MNTLGHHTCFNRRNSKICVGAVVMFVCFFVYPFITQGSGESLTLQIYPYAPGNRIMKQFTPLATYLSKEMGKKIILRISKDHDEHRSAVGNDEADIAYLGPATYVHIVDTHGKKPLIARLEINGSPMLRGVVITSSSSSLRSLKELRGKRFAFGYPDSTMSHLIPLYMLEREGIRAEDLAHYAFLNDQHNVALGVLMGDFDAGSVNMGIFNIYKRRGLKELARTPEVSEHLFVARNSLPEETIDALRAAFFKIKDTETGEEILSSLKKGMTAFVSVSDSDYDSLRRLLQKRE